MFGGGLCYRGPPSLNTYLENIFWARGLPETALTVGRISHPQDPFLAPSLTCESEKEVGRSVQSHHYMRTQTHLWLCVYFVCQSSTQTPFTVLCLGFGPWKFHRLPHEGLSWVPTASILWHRLPLAWAQREINWAIATRVTTAHSCMFLPDVTK